MLYGFGLYGVWKAWEVYRPGVLEAWRLGMPGGLGGLVGLEALEACRPGRPWRPGGMEAWRLEGLLLYIINSFSFILLGFSFRSIRFDKPYFS
jgi:hypothetical protein